jgi:hypothetical protein
MASQGEDVGCCYANVEDACETGCNAACKRAVTHNANSTGSVYQVSLNFNLVLINKIPTLNQVPFFNSIQAKFISIA